MNHRRRIVYAAALLAVLCAAAWLRLHGTPLFHPDEHLIADPAKYMPENRYRPTVFNYPHFYTNLVALTGRYLPGVGRGVFKTASPQIPPYYLRARCLTAGLGILTILAVCLAGISLGWPAAGLAGAAFLAVSFNHVENSHYATVDAPMTFNAAFAFLFACLHYRSGRTVWALLGGLFCGLTIGTKYNGGIILAPFILSLALVAVRRGGARGAWGVVAGAAAVPVGFLVACPYFIPLFAEYREEVLCQIRLYRNGFTGYDAEVGPPNWIWNWRYLYRAGMGPGAMLLAAGGCAVLCAREGWRGRLVACFPVLYYLYISRQAVRITRNLTVLTPFLALMAGYALWRLCAVISRRCGAHRAAGVALCAACTVAALRPSASLSVRYVRLLALPDPREQAIAWAQAHIPRGSKIAVDFMYGPHFPTDRYSVTNNELGAKPLSWYLEQNYDYIVTSSGFFAHWCPEAKRGLTTIYPELRRRFREVAFFPGEELGIPQGYFAISNRPTIAVYDLHAPRHAVARIDHPAPGSVQARDACPIRWTFTDETPGATQDGYQLVVERRRDDVTIVDDETLRANAVSAGGWIHESHVPGYLGSGFLTAPRDVPAMRISLTLGRSGDHDCWVRTLWVPGGTTRIGIGGLSFPLRTDAPRVWRWERLGKVALGDGATEISITPSGEGFTHIDALAFSADRGFDPSRDNEWTPAVDTGEVRSPEGSLPPSALRALPPGSYRARVRVRATTGEWGSWSPLTEFRLGP